MKTNRKPSDAASSAPSQGEPSEEKHSIVKAKRVRKLKEEEGLSSVLIARILMMKNRKANELDEKERRPSESIAHEKTIQSDKVDSRKITPFVSWNRKPIDFSSRKFEFSLGIGSFDEARKSMIVGYLTMVLVPTVILLAFISLSSPGNTVGARSLIRSMDHMLAIVAELGLPIMLLSWVVGLYPKGSYGRFVSRSMFAILLVVWLAILILESNLQDAFADSGTVLQLDRVLVIVGLIAMFYFGRAINEFGHCRRAWREDIGAKLKIAPLNLKSGFLDIDPHIGKLENGGSSAFWAYIQYLVVPTIVLIGLDSMLADSTFATKDVLIASFNAMFGTVVLFGGVMVIIRFMRGFYPSGSFGHAIFGLMGIPVLSSFAWMILLGSGIQVALELNHVIVDMNAVMLPVMMFILFMAIFEASELLDNRRSWHQVIGMPVKPWIMEKKYHSFHDFRRRYASFANGARKGRWVLSGFVLKILLLIILEAAVVSAYRYSGSGWLTRLIRSVFSMPTAGVHVDPGNTIYILLLVAMANTWGMFLAWSYRNGSMSRLVMNGIVAFCATTWAWFFWMTLIDIVSSKVVVNILTIVMVGSFMLIASRAVWAMFGEYLKNREAYLGWRSVKFYKQVVPEKPSLTPGAPAPVDTSKGSLDG